MKIFVDQELTLTELMNAILKSAGYLTVSVLLPVRRFSSLPSKQSGCLSQNSSFFTHWPSPQARYP